MPGSGHLSKIDSLIFFPFNLTVDHLVLFVACLVISIEITNN